MARSTLALALLGVCLALLSFAAPAAASVAGSDEFLISTSTAGCTSVAHIDTAYTLTGLASSACPTYEYVYSNSTSSLSTGSTPAPTGISIALSAVDPVLNTLYLVESEADGNSTLAASPITNRSKTTRQTLGAGVSAIAMTLGLQSSTATATPLLLLTSSPSLALISFAPSTGAASTLLTAAKMTTQLNMSHAVAGVLTLNSGAAEVYWVGLSANTPLIPATTVNGTAQPNTTALYLFSFSLASGSASAVPLTGITDVLSMQYSEEISSLVFVTSTDVRTASVPSAGLASSKASVAVTTVSSTTFSSAIPNYYAVYASSRWLPLAQQIVIGVQLESGSNTSYAIVSFTLTQSSSTVVSTSPNITVVADLPLIFQYGIAPLSLTSVSPSTLTPLTAYQVAITGTGFGQALVRDSLVCTFYPELSDGSFASPLSVSASLNNTLVTSSGSDEVLCALPATLVTSSVDKVLVYVSAWNGRINSTSYVTMFITCDAGYTLTNGACVECGSGTYKSSKGSAACTTCPSGTTSANGSTSVSDCMADDPCDYSTDGTNTGAKTAVTITFVVDMEPGDFTDTVQNELLALIAAALDITVDRLSITDAEPYNDATQVLVTLEIEVADDSDYATCLTDLAAGGSAATEHQGWSPAALATLLNTMLNDTSSALYSNKSSELSQAIKTDTNSKIVSVPTSSGSTSLAQCAENNIIPLVLAFILIAATCGVYLFCPCRMPRQKNVPIEARPFEILPAVLPLIALGFDAYFITVIPAAFSLQMIWMAIVGVLIVAGIAHNIGTMAWYGPAQLRKEPATAAPVSTKYVQPIKTMEGEGVPTDSPLNLWRKPHSAGSKAAVTLAALNFNVLAMLTAQLSSKTTLWDLQWDAQRAGSKPYHAMIWAAGLRNVLFRQLPMLAIQVGILTQMECPFAAVPAVLCGAAALIANIGRLIALRNMLEPGVALAARRHMVMMQKRQDGWATDSEFSVSSSRSSISSSRGSTSASGASATGRVSTPAGAIIAASPKSSAMNTESEDEDGMAYVESEHSQLPGMAEAEAEAPDGTTLLSSEEEIAAAAEEARLRPHGWMLSSGPDPMAAGFKEHGVSGGFGRAKKRALPMKAPVESEVAINVASRVALAEAAEKEIASAANVWLLFEEIDNVEPVLAPGDELRSVEQFDEAGMPFEPAQFKRFIKKAESVESAPVEERQANAAAAMKEVNASHIWMMIEEIDEAPKLTAGDQVKSVEQFDDEGLPFQPAQFKRFIKRNKDAVRDAEDRQRQMEIEKAKEARIAAALAARNSLSHASRKTAGTVSRGSVSQISSVESSEPEEPVVVVAASSPVVERPTSASLSSSPVDEEEDEPVIVSPINDSIASPPVMVTRDEEDNSPEESVVSLQGGARFGSQTASETASVHEFQGHSSSDSEEESVRRERNTVDFGEENGSLTLLQIQARQAAEAAARGTVQVSELEREERYRVGRGEGEEAQIIGDLGMVGRRATPPSRSPSISLNNQSPSVSSLGSQRLTGGSPFSKGISESAFARMQAQVLERRNAAAAAAAAAWSSPLGPQSGSAEVSQTGSMDGDDFDLESREVEPVRRAGRRSTGARIMGANGSVDFSSPSAGPRRPARQSSHVRSPSGSLADDSLSSPTLGAYPPRRVAKVVGFGSGSSREKLTADEIRAKKTAEMAERRSMAAATGAQLMTEGPSSPNNGPRLPRQISSGSISANFTSPKRT